MYTRRFIVPKIERQSDFGSLIRSVLGLEKIENRGEALKVFLLRFRLDVEYVLRSFVIAALRNWIFETNFPFTQSPKDRVLNVTRQVVSDLGKNLPQSLLHCLTLFRRLETATRAALNRTLSIAK